jgi:hypothetical protein
MADFDLTQVPTLVAQRLDAAAADAMTRGQEMFAKALEDQRTLLAALASPAASISTATAARAQRLAEGPAPRGPDDDAASDSTSGDSAPASPSPAPTA